MRRLIAVLCLLAGTAHGQVLWQQAQAGMTRQQLQAEFPQATTSGEILELTGVVVAGVPFKVRFAFRGDALERVSLQATVSGPLNADRLRFDAITEALRGKYGPELSHKDRFGALGFTSDWDWLTPEISVGALGQLSDAGGTILVTYKVRKTGEKL